MEYLDYHSSIAEQHRYSNEVTMETRTFRIIPVRRGAEIEVIDVIQKQTRIPNAPTKNQCADEDGDDLAVDAPNSRKLQESHTGNFFYPSHDMEDARDDEPSPPTALRSYNRKDHRRFCQKPFRPKNSQQKGCSTSTTTTSTCCTTSRASTETEKRIAQLQNAGLLISTKAPVSSTRRLVDVPSQTAQEEKRDAPSKLPSSTVNSRGSVVASFKNKIPSSALRALLEKDSLQQQRYLTCGHRLPPTPLPRTKPTADAPPFARDTTIPVDPIIAARPLYKGLRVSFRDYPDATAFGWTFCGSCEDVEYFERTVPTGGRVVLEFHYTTGTVKASLHDSNRGNSRLLAYCMGGLSSKIYQKILLDPLGCSESDENAGDFL